MGACDITPPGIAGPSPHPDREPLPGNPRPPPCAVPAVAPGDALTFSPPASRRRSPGAGRRFPWQYRCPAGSPGAAAGPGAGVAGGSADPSPSRGRGGAAGREPGRAGPCNETDASVSDTETWTPCSHGDSLPMRRSARSPGEPCLAPYAPPTITSMDANLRSPPRIAHCTAGHPGVGDGCCGSTASSSRSWGAQWDPLLPTQCTLNWLLSPGSSCLCCHTGG